MCINYKEYFLIKLKGFVSYVYFIINGFPVQIAGPIEF
jgi:hypothetical protein